MKSKHNVTTRKKEEIKILHWENGLGAPNFDPVIAQPTKNYINGFNSLVDYFQTKDYISTNPEIFGYRLTVQPYSKFQMPIHVDRLKETRKRQQYKSVEMDQNTVKKEDLTSSATQESLMNGTMSRTLKNEDFEKRHRVMMESYREKKKNEQGDFSNFLGAKHSFSIHKLQHLANTENSFHKSANTTISANETSEEAKHLLSTPPFKNPFDKRNYQFNKIINSLSANEKSWKKITENLARSDSPYQIGANLKKFPTKFPKTPLPSGS